MFKTTKIREVYRICILIISPFFGIPVYRTATEVALLGKNPMRDYYDYLREKGVAHQNAKNAVARYLARVSYGMMKNGTTYEPYRWRKKQ